MENEKTKMQKFKSWVKKHEEDIVAGTVFTATAGFVAVVIVAAFKEQNKLEREAAEARQQYNDWVDEMNHWIVDETNKGNDIYALDDGTYLVVPHESEKTLVIK